VYQFAHDRRQLFGKIGIIYNGNPNDPSDAAWVQSARDHVIATTACIPTRLSSSPGTCIRRTPCRRRHPTR
jgi:hypothetical protein